MTVFIYFGESCAVNTKVLVCPVFVRNTTCTGVQYYGKKHRLLFPHRRFAVDRVTCAVIAQHDLNTPRQYDPHGAHSACSAIVCAQSVSQKLTERSN